MLTTPSPRLTQKAITDRSVSSRGEYRDGRIHFTGPMAAERAKAFAEVLRSYDEPAQVTAGLDKAVVTTRFARKAAPEIRRVKPVVDDVTRALDKARKVQANKPKSTVRSYTVEFLRPVWRKQNGEPMIGRYSSARWEVLFTAKVTAANATEAFEQACNSRKGGLRPAFESFAFAMVRPGATSTYRPEASRDFGDFYAYRSVSDNKWACHKGLPGDTGNYDDC